MSARYIPFIASLLFFAATYGYMAASYKLFPYQFIADAQKGYRKIKEMAGLELPWIYHRVEQTIFEGSSRVFPPD